MAQKTKVDWIDARQTYLADETVSYADISKQYKVSLTTVKERGAKEGWPKLRQNLTEKAFDNFQKKLLKTKEQAQDRHLQQFQNLQALINKSIMAIAKQEQPDALELRRLSGALKDSVMGERVVLGLPTNVGSITDPEGNDAFKGFAEAFAAAEKVVNGDSSTST